MLGGIDFFLRSIQPMWRLPLPPVSCEQYRESIQRRRPFLFTQSEKRGKTRRLPRPVGDAIGRGGGKLSNPIDWKLAVAREVIGCLE